MEPNEALGVAAQVAATLAGFAGIVVVFRPTSIHEWSQTDRLRLVLLLINSILPLVLSLFAMLLLTIKPGPAWIWGWCSLMAVFCQLAVPAFARRTTNQVTPGSWQIGGRILFYGIFAAGMGAFILQFLNIFLWNRFWPFFFIIFVQLVAAVLQFARFILLSHASPE